MQELVESGRLIDAILASVLLQFAALASLHRLRGIGPAPRDLWPNLAAGAALLLAVRAALTDASWIAVAAWLACALVAHLIDLHRRWPRS